MNKEEMRKAFECHMKSLGFLPAQLYKMFRSDNYGNEKVHYAWQAWQARQPEIDALKELVYEVDQGLGGARITYKEALMGAEASARAWKAAYKTHKAEVERLKAEIVDLKNALYEAQGEK